MRLPYFAKVFFTEWLTTGVLGPALLFVTATFWGGPSGLFLRGVSLVSMLWVFLLMGFLGYTFARLVTLPRHFYRRYLPLLLFPLLLMLAWAYALHSSDGDYSVDTLPWRVTRMLALLPQELLLTGEWPSIDAFLESSGFLPGGIHRSISFLAQVFFMTALALPAGLGCTGRICLDFFAAYGVKSIV